jgi:hypothetical protein
VTFGLKPIALSDSLKKWSPDLYEVFTYIQTKKPDLKDNTLRIVTVLFDKTLHNGHFARVQFGTVQNFLARPNNTLNLVVLTLLQQLQEYFFDKKNYENGDWSKRGKYCGTTSNKLKDTAPLANINFCKFSKQLVLQQITNVTEFKPLEDKKGVMTSLEEWALRILRPSKSFN